MTVRHAIRAGIWALLWALFFGFVYAQLARGLGVPNMLIGVTAIIAQAATYFCVLVLQLGRFWR